MEVRAKKLKFKGLPAGPLRTRIEASRQGFSLVEMIVAIFVFSLIMTTVITTFVQAVGSRKKIQAIQQDIEDARYAIELMAKTLRTSSVVSSTATEIKVHDYSQQLCVGYSWSNNALWLSTAAWDSIAKTCGTWTTPAVMTSNSLYGLSLIVTPSTSTSLGKVTIAMKICNKTVCSGPTSDTTTIQTTISLRDYQEINP